MSTRRTSKHRVFSPPSAETLAWKRHRACHNWTGVPKLRYTPTEADAVVTRMNARPDAVPVEAYACPVCGWMHVGRQSLRGQGTLDEMIVLESGERVAACERMENTGSERARLTAIMSRLESAQARRLATAPSPRRTTPLP